MSRKTLMHLVALTAFAMLALPVAAQGGVIATYNFGDATGAPTSTDPAITGGTVAVYGTASGGIITGGVGGSSDYFVKYFSVDVKGSLASAITNGDYFTLSITSDGTHQVDNWTSLTFRYGNSTNNGEAPRNFALYSSTDNTNFAQVGSSVLFTGLDGRGWPSGSDFVGSIDLSSLATLGAGQTLYFQMYVWHDGSGTSTSRWGGVDNMVINATVSDVPEPATLTLLALGGVAVVALRRKRR